jgi:hypothetical protein
MILQNSMELVEAVPSPYSEIYAISQDIKAEQLSDVQEEEDPLLLTSPVIKAEHEVSCHHRCCRIRESHKSKS